jgi:predicted negative regulator of RcsB-dependent stress response
LSSSELARAVALLEKGNWQAAHKIVQTDEDSALACWAHGIVHLMEGDVSNARYWYREAKRPFPKSPAAPQEIVQLRAALRG